MKSKFIIFGILVLTLLFVASLEMASTCYSNRKEIPCDIFWAQYGWFMTIPFLFLGLLLSIKPDWILNYQVLQMKILGSIWIPGKIIPKIYRAIGIVFLVLGLYFLYHTMFH